MDNVFPLFLIFVYILFLIIRYIRLNGEATTISGILISIGLYLCVVPIIAIASGENYSSHAYLKHLTNNMSSYFSCYFAILIFLLTLQFSYTNARVRQRQCKITIDNNKMRISSKYLSYFTFIVGGISFLLYAKAFGGFEQLLLYAEIMRSFAVDKADMVSGQAFILVIPSRLITVSPFLFLIYRQFTNKKFFNIVLIILSTILAGIFYLSNAGKAGILIFGLCFFVSLLSYKFKHKWLITIIIAIFGLEIINYLDSLFVYLNTGQFEAEVGQGAVSYISQFSYPIGNLLNLHGISSLHGFRYGQDFITGILNIIPGVNFETSYSPTSEFYGGINWNITGGTPNDAITFGFLQFGYFGVAFVAYLIGRLCSYVDACMLSLNNSFANRVLKYSLVILYFSLFVNADVVSIVRNQFALTLLTLCVILASRKKRINLIVKNTTQIAMKSILK